MTWDFTAQGLTYSLPPSPKYTHGQLHLVYISTCIYIILLLCAVYHWVVVTHFVGGMNKHPFFYPLPPPFHPPTNVHYAPYKPMPSTARTIHACAQHHHHHLAAHAQRAN